MIAARLRRIGRAAVGLLSREGSTRSLALIRVSIAALLWARWAGDLSLYHHLEADWLAIGASFFAATTLMFFGVCTRLSTLWTALTIAVVFFYLGFVRDQEPFTHHHTWLLVAATGVLALTPCGRSYSVDRWRAVRRAAREGRPAPAERGPIWGLHLLALQVAVVYFWAAWDKCSLAWLSGARMEHVVMHLYVGSDRPEGLLWAAATTGSALGTTALEFALAAGLWVPRLRRWLIPLGMAFHGLIYLTLPVLTFTLTMWALYLAFLDPDAVHRVIDRLHEAPAASNA